METARGSSLESKMPCLSGKASHTQDHTEQDSDANGQSTGFQSPIQAKAYGYTGCDVSLVTFGKENAENGTSG